MPKTVLSQMEARMKKALEDLQADLSTLRTGRATPTLLDKISLEYYGAPTPIKSLAAISAPDARQLLVAPFDKTTTGPIASAISKSDLGVSAVVDGHNVRVSIPSLNQERRQEMVKLAGKKAEAHKIAIRNIRRDANEALKKMEKEGELTKDDVTRTEGDVQKITDRYIAEVDKVRAAKESDILEV